MGHPLKKESMGPEALRFLEKFRRNLLWVLEVRFYG